MSEQPIPNTQEHSSKEVMSNIERTINSVKDFKQTTVVRSPVDRACAVTITELEKAYAYFKTFVYEEIKDRESNTPLIDSKEV